jgi:MFS family permease
MSIFSFIARNPRWLLGGFLLTFFSSFGQTFFIALSAGEIRSEYNLSHGDFGLLYMVATLASALTLPWLGKIVDHHSARKVTFIIVPLLTIGTLAMAFSTHLASLVIAIYILRLFGQGMMTQNALTATARWFSASRGRAISLVTLGHNVGEALLPFIFVAIAAVIGWRYTWIASSVLLIVIALPTITILLSKERQQQVSETAHNAQSDKHWTRAEVVRDPWFWVLLSGVLAPPIIGTTIFFHQVYLVELRGWSLTIFASAFPVMAMSTIIFALITGYSVDRFGAVRLLPTFLIPLALSCFALATIDAQWTPFIFMSLMGVSYGFSSTLVGAIWPEIYGTQHLGAIRALVVSMMVLGTAAGPGISGWLIDNDIDYLKQIIAMGIYCLIACVALYLASRHFTARSLHST